ncbi:MAG TPA: L-glutamate gamma-semialdehyde dehydrogenase [Acidobacteriota bacterium]|nr:L-glutamate gamma-semialdehyde dehydrogenase [Acidobacteriota bacterium]
MPAGRFITPRPVNEKVRDYGPGSEDKTLLKRELERQAAHPVEIAPIVGGRPVLTGRTGRVACPHDHGLDLGVYHMGTPDVAGRAIAAAAAAKAGWQGLPWEDRAAVFLKAADLLAGPYRYTMNAATMLGQSKTVFQAEIDSVCELADYLRFNVSYVCRILSAQPEASPQGSWNKLEYRPLDGFVLAVAPFNFTSIGGNLPTAPAMMGNTVIWKPASSALLSAHYFMRILIEAGLPDGVINMVPGAGAEIVNPAVDHADLAGVHFTGSTGTFIYIWGRVAANLGRRVYRNYPRLVGETGGKDFILACPDADLDELAVAMFRGAFEYQGQKCSAASRAYIPGSLWPGLLDRLKKMSERTRVGDVRDFRNFMGAVIDRAAFDRITGYIAEARASDRAEIAVGGESDDTKGFFIRPTVVRTSDPKSRGMSEEIFGPVLTVYVYEDRDFEGTLALVDGTSPYALTGSIFGRDRTRIRLALDRLSQAAGNVYINDKPTGAVVGQQPFGGGRLSGTNDKAGGYFNMLRWTSPQAVKESFAPPKDPFYPHMSEE